MRDRHAPPDAPAPLRGRLVAEFVPGVCAIVVRDFVAAPARPSPSHERAGPRARAARAAASRVLPHHSEHVLKQPRAFPSIPLTKKPYLETCPISTGRKTRRVHLVWGEGRDVSS